MQKLQNELPLRSGGPRTPAGLARSSRNAVTHGLTAETAVLPGEDPETWRIHLEGIIDSLQPLGALEQELAERVALLLWRLRRVAAYEIAAGRLLYGAAENVPPSLDGPDPEAVRALAVLPDVRRMKKLIRYEAHVDRSLHRALDRLQDLQARRGVLPPAKLLAVAVRVEREQP